MWPLITLSTEILYQWTSKVLDEVRRPDDIGQQVETQANFALFG